MAEGIVIPPLPRREKLKGSEKVKWLSQEHSWQVELEVLFLNLAISLFVININIFP